METRPISDTLSEAFRWYHFATFSQGVPNTLRGMVSVLLRHDRKLGDMGVWKQVPEVPKKDRAEPFCYATEKVPRRYHEEVPISPGKGRGLGGIFLWKKTIACNGDRKNCLYGFERYRKIECRLPTDIRYS